MKHTTRSAAFVALGAVTAVAMAACGAPGTADSGSKGASSQSLAAPAKKSGTLTMVTKFADPKYAPYFESVAKAYEQANPDVTVKLEQVGDQPYKDKIRVLSASKQLPDIFFSWAGDFANKFVRAGLAADLSSVIGPDTEWGKTFSPASLKAFETKGKNYGVPIDLDAKYMAYNKAAFAKAGVDAAPKTLEEMLGACDKLKSAGYTPVAFGNQYGWPAIHYITQLNAYNVPPTTLAKDYDPATGEFTDPGYAKAVDQFRDIVTRCSSKDANGVSHEAGQANFINGKAAMHFLESVEFQVLTAKGGAPKEVADNWDFMRLPAPQGAAGDTGALTGAPDGFMVNAQSKNAALAVDFLKFMTNQQNAAKLTADIGWLSPVQGSATSQNSFPQLQAALADISKANQFAIWLDTVTNAEVANAYLSGVEGVISGSKTSKDVMTGVQQAAAKAKKQAG
jgi:raffinose/stachyose/melibiose transport system substrate-binding protein